MAATPKSSSSPAARPGRSESRCSWTARSVSRSWISSAARPISVWACSVWTWAFPGRTIRAAAIRVMPACPSSGAVSATLATRQRGVLPIATSDQSRSAPTSPRSPVPTISGSGTASIGSRSTTGSPNAPTRAGASTSPGTRPGRLVPGRRPGTSTTSTRRFSSVWSAPRARAISTSCSPDGNGSTRMFVRDRWTVGQKLTLDLGLRWEYYPIMSRADRQIETAGPGHAERADRRCGRQSEEHGTEGAAGLLYAAGWRRLPAE